MIIIVPKNVHGGESTCERYRWRIGTTFHNGEKAMLRKTTISAAILCASITGAVSAASATEIAQTPYEQVDSSGGIDVRVIAAPFIIIGKNIEGAVRESGVGAQVLKGVTGVSVKDIKENGVFGGPNSFFRKPFGF